MKFESTYYFLESTSQGYWIVNKLTRTREAKVQHLHQGIESMIRLDAHLEQAVGDEGDESFSSGEEAIH